MWHTIPTNRATIIAALKHEGDRDGYGDARIRCRTYRAVATMTDMDMMASVGLPPEHVKNFLLHYEGNGVPHAVSVRFDTTANTATVIDGACVYKIPIGSFRNVYLTGAPPLYRTGSETLATKPMGRQQHFWTWLLELRTSLRKMPCRMTARTGIPTPLEGYV